MTDKTIELSQEEWDNLEKSVQKIEYERSVFRECLKALVSGMEQTESGIIVIKLSEEKKELLERVVDNLL